MTWSRDYESFLSKRGDRISELKGCIGEMSHDQQRAILVNGKNDYSVQYSTSKRKYHLWLGPAAFLNHGNSKKIHRMVPIDFFRLQAKCKNSINWQSFGICLRHCRYKKRWWDFNFLWKRFFRSRKYRMRMPDMRTVSEWYV